MRAAVAIAIAAALAAVLGAAARAGDDRPHGFDHTVHDGKVSVTGAPAIPCTDCHVVDRVGAVRGGPGHDACFGACHGDPPARPRRARGKLAATPVPADRARVCAACHAPAALAALAAGGATEVPAAAPRDAIEPDFGLTLSHARHDAATGCTTCHDGAGRPAGGRSHARCSGCHLAPASSGAPPMSSCTSCHAAAYGPARGPELITGALSVAAGFAHDRHARRSAAACTDCHAGVAAVDGADLPAPSMGDCGAGGCHDGKAAFATTEACTRCHAAAPTVSYQLVLPAPEDPDDRWYSHARHRARLADGGACGTCHGIDARGEAPAPGHRACADAGCHAADFASTTPTTCAACHVAIEPWRALDADALPRAETEFGAAMPHAAHADLGLTCERCHSLTTPTRDRRPPRGHASCTGDGCHARASGPSPRLDDCGACHQAGLVERRVRERRAAPWSVRARFAHAPHERDAAGAALPCDTCHAGVWTTDALPPAPAKATCAPCHDGKAAFKMTGHGCARCHGE